jgi:hypothetical protein
MDLSYSPDPFARESIILFSNCQWEDFGEFGKIWDFGKIWEEDLL